MEAVEYVDSSVYHVYNQYSLTGETQDHLRGLSVFKSTAVDIFSGSVAGVCGLLVGSPFDLIKVRNLCFVLDPLGAYTARYN